MPRPWRIEFAGACYHVINRGNYRRHLFRDKGAAAAFERTLAEAATRFGWWIHAYVVMSNHFHLALELAEPNLSEGMKWLQGTWIRRYNSYRQLVGRPFQGRYKAILVETGESFGRVCDYIHLNPVRAGLVKAAAVADYPWSSLPKFLSSVQIPWLQTSTAQARIGDLGPSAAGWKRYRNHLEFLAGDPEAKKQLCAEKLSRGWCVGSAEFKAQMKTEHARRGELIERFAGLEPEALRAERQAEWQRMLAAIARGAGIDLRRLPARYSHPDKLLLAVTLKAHSSVSNRWLAENLRLGRTSSVGQLLHRFRRSPQGQACLQLPLDGTT